MTPEAQALVHDLYVTRIASYITIPFAFFCGVGCLVCFLVALEYMPLDSYRKREPKTAAWLCAASVGFFALTCVLGAATHTLWNMADSLARKLDDVERAEGDEP
jgi:hypothetical protein